MNKTQKRRITTIVVENVQRIEKKKVAVATKNEQRI